MAQRMISHYRLLDKLGAGGMGEVYLAEDTRLGRRVAIKVLPSGSSRDQSSRIINEARLIASLDHPNICAIHEVGEAEGQNFLVMQYVEGETLDSVIKSRLPAIRESLDWAAQIADALAEAHSRKIIHGDIKPQNIIITPRRQVKLMDFGLARAANIAESSSGVTGTILYMSPEQARGEAVSASSDIFSFGVLLYEMMSGHHPFAGDSAGETLSAMLARKPLPAGTFRDDIPLALDRIISKAIEKSPDDRYPSAREMASDLRRLKENLDGNQREIETAEQRGSDIEPTSPWQVFGWKNRKRLLASGIIAAIAAGVNALANGNSLASLALLLAAAICLTVFAAIRRRGAPAISMLPVGTAFRGLLPFQETDRNRFYGREVETMELFDAIAHKDFQFGVLYGESGCGKTSIVRAGLAPRLWEEGYTPVYCRSYRDPIAAIRDECRRLSHVEMAEGETITEYLRRVADEMDSTIVVICDQFEEFFISFRVKREREPFTTLVADCLSTDAPVKFLLSMRSDFLYLINSEFRGKVAEPLASSRLYHLENFDQEQAEMIIERSVRQAGLPFEPGLGRQVSRDLAVEGIVHPSELQIVGEQLQRKRISTLEEYRRAGGKEPLVHGFLEDVIQASGDQEGARLLMRSLISDENTRLTLPLAEIARRVQRSLSAVENMLHLLAGARLVREIQEEEPWRYELMHEYLIEKINQVTGRVMDATERANRLFRQYLTGYRADKTTRIPVGKLFFIRRYSDIKRGEREQELLTVSLRRGLLRAGAMAALLIFGATIGAAALSVSEEWESARLSDGHTAAARRAVFSTDGNRLITVGEDRRVIVWDFARRERLATFTDHTDRVCSLAFSPDGLWFATGDYSGNLIVWDARRLEKATMLEGHQGSIGGLAFSSDGKLLASSSGERTILWKAGNWERAGELTPGVNEHGSLFFSADSRFLIGAHGVQIRDIVTGRQAVSEERWFTWAALSPDGERMVGIDAEGTVSFFYVNQFRNAARLKRADHLRVHRDHGRAAAFSPDGKLAATGAEDIVLWDATTQTRITRLQHSSIVWSLAFSPDGRWLVSTHGDGSVVIWDAAEREPVASLSEHSGPVRAVAFSPDGKRVASASEDRSIIIWDAETRRKEAVLTGHETRVSSVAFARDGNLIASSDQEGNVMMWDAARRLAVWRARPPNISSSYCLAISPDGRWVATTNGIYETSEGRHVLSFNFPAHSYGVSFSADGRWLACAAGEAVLWDTESWRIADRTGSIDMGQVSVSFSPDNKQLATGSDDGTVRLWHLDPLREVAMLGRHAARVKFVTFSPDGSEVASASDDQTIALWDVSRHNLITRIGTHTAPVLSVAFSPDGKRLVSGEHDRSVRLYTRRRTLWGYRLD
ncbi:MAG: protein kinase [Acidobacteriota bacterium]